MTHTFDMRPSFPTTDVIADCRAEALAILDAPLCPGDTVAPRGFGEVKATVGVANGEPKYVCRWWEPALQVWREARLLREDVMFVPSGAEA